jgi:hypothetical protein
MISASQPVIQKSVGMVTHFFGEFMASWIDPVLKNTLHKS